MESGAVRCGLFLTLLVHVLKCIAQHQLEVEYICLGLQVLFCSTRGMRSWRLKEWHTILGQTLSRLLWLLIVMHMSSPWFINPYAIFEGIYLCIWAQDVSYHHVKIGLPLLFICRFFKKYLFLHSVLSKISFYKKDSGFIAMARTWVAVKYHAFCSATGCFVYQYMQTPKGKQS